MVLSLDGLLVLGTGTIPYKIQVLSKSALLFPIGTLPAWSNHNGRDKADKLQQCSESWRARQPVTRQTFVARFDPR